MAATAPDVPGPLNNASPMAPAQISPDYSIGGPSLPGPGEANGAFGLGDIAGIMGAWSRDLESDLRRLNAKELDDMRAFELNLSRDSSSIISSPPRGATRVRRSADAGHPAAGGRPNGKEVIDSGRQDDYTKGKSAPAAEADEDLSVASFSINLHEEDVLKDLRIELDLDASRQLSFSQSLADLPPEILDESLNAADSLADLLREVPWKTAPSSFPSKQAGSSDRRQLQQTDRADADSMHRTGRSDVLDVRGDNSETLGGDGHHADFEEDDEDLFMHPAEYSFGQTFPTQTPTCRTDFPSQAQKHGDPRRSRVHAALVVEDDDFDKTEHTVPYLEMPKTLSKTSFVTRSPPPTRIVKNARGLGQTPHGIQATLHDTAKSKTEEDRRPVQSVKEAAEPADHSHHSESTSAFQSVSISNAPLPAVSIPPTPEPSSPRLTILATTNLPSSRQAHSASSLTQIPQFQRLPKSMSPVKRNTVPEAAPPARNRIDSGRSSPTDATSAAVESLYHQPDLKLVEAVDRMSQQVRALNQEKSSLMARLGELESELGKTREQVRCVDDDRRRKQEQVLEKEMALLDLQRRVKCLENIVQEQKDLLMHYARAAPAPAADAVASAVAASPGSSQRISIPARKSSPPPHIRNEESPLTAADPIPWQPSEDSAVISKDDHPEQKDGVIRGSSGIELPMASVDNLPNAYDSGRATSAALTTVLPDRYLRAQSDESTEKRRTKDAGVGPDRIKRDSSVQTDPDEISEPLGISWKEPAQVTPSQPVRVPSRAQSAERGTQHREAGTKVSRELIEMEIHRRVRALLERKMELKRQRQMKEGVEDRERDREPVGSSSKHVGQRQRTRNRSSSEDETGPVETGIESDGGRSTPRPGRHTARRAESRSRSRSASPTPRRHVLSPNERAAAAPTAQKEITTYGKGLAQSKRRPQSARAPTVRNANLAGQAIPVPFVVGTNTGKSYSVPVNLQRMFSMLKTHNPHLCTLCSSSVGAVQDGHYGPHGAATVSGSAGGHAPEASRGGLSLRRPLELISAHLDRDRHLLEDQLHHLHIAFERAVRASDVAPSLDEKRQLHAVIQGIIRKMSDKADQLQNLEGGAGPASGAAGASVSVGPVPRRRSSPAKRPSNNGSARRAHSAHRLGATGTGFPAVGTGYEPAAPRYVTAPPGHISNLSTPVPAAEKPTLRSLSLLRSSQKVQEVLQTGCK